MYKTTTEQKKLTYEFCERKKVDFSRHVSRLQWIKEELQSFVFFFHMHTPLNPFYALYMIEIASNFNATTKTKNYL